MQKNLIDFFLNDFEQAKTFLNKKLKKGIINFFRKFQIKILNNSGEVMILVDDSA